MTIGGVTTPEFGGAEIDHPRDITLPAHAMKTLFPRIGAAIGIPIAIASSRVIAGRLFGLTPGDPRWLFARPPRFLR